MENWLEELDLIEAEAVPESRDMIGFYPWRDTKKPDELRDHLTDMINDLPEGPTRRQLQVLYGRVNRHIEAHPDA